MSEHTCSYPGEGGHPCAECLVEAEEAERREDEWEAVLTPQEPEHTRLYRDTMKEIYQVLTGKSYQDDGTRGGGRR